MDPSVRLQRHAQLWESAAANARRYAVAGVIFAVLILLNVIEPHYRVENQKNNLPELQTQLASLKAEQASLAMRKSNLQAVGEVLEDVRSNIARAPWQTDIQALIRTCAGGCPRDVQSRANQTIRSIAEKMRRISVEPLGAAVKAASLEAELEDSVADIEEAINSWEQSKLNTVWYGTIASKQATAAAVGSNVTAETRRAEGAVGTLNEETSGEIADISDKLETKQKEIAGDQDQVSNDIKEQEEKIAQAMQAALPGWAADLVTVKSMVSLYPWILAVLGLLTVGYGLIAGRHYRAMADAEGWSKEDRADPLMSTPWTLTDRGLTGGLATVMLHGGVLTIFAYCLYRAISAAEQPEVAAQSEQALSVGLPAELAFGLLAVALILAVVAVRRRPS
ncbi:MAG: hypothetical protein HKN59_03645 [Gammaproteobacteria bacterium]|nr:hypothetical protein [Gammaproteobacteria bacterium]